MTRSDKPEMTVGGEDEMETFDQALRGKYQGTSEDDRDMRVLGKAQVLNVSWKTLFNAREKLTFNSETSDSSRPWDLLAR